MARSIQVAVSAELADSVLSHLEGMEGILGVARQRNTSISPPGDIVTIETSNDAMRVVIGTLSRLGVPSRGSIHTSELKSVFSPRNQKFVEDESNETGSEEMAVLLRQETNIDVNYLAVCRAAR